MLLLLTSCFSSYFYRHSLLSHEFIHYLPHFRFFLVSCCPLNIDYISFNFITTVGFFFGWLLDHLNSRNKFCCLFIFRELICLRRIRLVSPLKKFSTANFIGDARSALVIYDLVLVFDTCSHHHNLLVSSSL